MSGAVVVLSGGADSTLCLYWAKAHFDPVMAVSFDYGQSHHVELAAAQKIAKLAKVEHECINIGQSLRSTSPLTDKSKKLETYSDFSTMSDVIGNRVELTFIPLRNTLFLTAAANRAVYWGFRDIIIGVCEADGANYPDCTHEFINSVQWTINVSLGLNNTPPEFHIHTQLINRTKAQSVKESLKYNGCYTALAYSHTAYSGEFPPVTQDHATVLRAHGFEEAGYPDPMMVRAYWMDRLDALPTTSNYKKYEYIFARTLVADDEDLYHKLYNLELYFRNSDVSQSENGGMMDYWNAKSADEIAEIAAKTPGVRGSK